MATVNSIITDISTLSAADKRTLKQYLAGMFSSVSVSMETFVKEERFSQGLVCPLCGCVHIVRNGRRKDGTQRYICRDCGRSFVATSNSIVSCTKKNFIVWEKNIDCMMLGLSLRKTANICGINRNTAFAWRHKILKPFRTWLVQLSLMALLRQMRLFLLYLIRVTTRTAGRSPYPADPIREAVPHIFGVYLVKKSVFPAL